MDRRTLLGGTGSALAVALAGCIGELGAAGERILGDGATDGDHESGGDESSGDGGGADAGGADGGAGTDGADEIAHEPAVLDHEFVESEQGHYVDRRVEATVENVGDGAGPILVEVQWYDEDGHALGESREPLSELEPGAVWDSRVTLTRAATGGRTVGDYEVEARAVPEDDLLDPLSDDTVLESDVGADGADAVATGTVENRGVDERTLEIRAIFVDENGTVLGDAWDVVKDLPPGDTWAFEASHRYRGDRVADADVDVFGW